MANVKVKISVNGKTYQPKTNSHGVAKLAIKLKPGNYKVTSTNPKTKFKLTTNFRVYSTIQSYDLTKVYGNNKYFVAKFFKSNGKPLSNTRIKYKLDGKKFFKKTDGHGIAYIYTKNLTKGKHKIKLYNIDGLRKANTINVVKSSKTRLIASDLTALKGSSKSVKVIVADQFGYILPSGYVVKAKINGKTYKAKINSVGIAKIKMRFKKEGIYSVKYYFKAKGYYKSSKAYHKINVIPSKNPTFTVKSTKSFGYGAHTPFILKLSSGNVPLVKRNVNLNINGNSYWKTTDNNGIVSMPIDLAIGKYTVKYFVYKGQATNYKSGSTKITVKQRIHTSVEWLGNDTLYQGPNTCKLLLKDSNNNSISGKKISLVINSVTYKSTTDRNGIATFNIIIPPGIQGIYFKYEGDNDYEPVSHKYKVNSTYRVVSGYGYWIKKEQFESVSLENLSSLAAQGVTDIFLNSNSVSAFGKDRVESWISDANGLGMKVHFWVQVFFNDYWTNPIVNGAINNKFYTQKINEIKGLSQIKGISGIHLDYIRFKSKAYKTPGSTNAINEFVRQSALAIRSISQELILSCALVAKMDKSGYYYGQDYSFISRYMDVVMPMIYKGNAAQSSGWITSTAKWYVDNSKGAKVWVGLQTYRSDKDYTVLPLNEMNIDAQAAINGGASGLVLFRWGLTSYIDFKNLI